MSKVRYTDATRYRQPYVTAKESEEPGYLKRRFDEIRAKQAAADAEAKAKTTTLQKRRIA